MSKSLWNRFTNILDYNPATLSGVLDAIVVEGKNGVKNASAFHLRAGKFKVFRPEEKEVELYINGQLSPYKMKLSKKGIGYFEVEAKNNETDFESEADFLQSEDEFLQREKRLSPDEDKEDKVKSEGDGDNVFKNDKEFSSDEDIGEAYSKDRKKNPMENKMPRKMSNNGIRDDYVITKPKPYKAEDADDEETQIEMSLCADYLTPDMEKEEIYKIFDEHKISYTRFDNNPHSVINNPKLMIKVGDKIYESYIGIPQILSKLAFDKDLTDFSLNKMARNEEEDEKINEVLNKSKKTKVYRKTLKPTPEMVESFNLKEGVNKLVYKFKGNLNSTYTLDSRIFYYKYKPQYRVIISDIDGTITRSDVLGHLMPFVNQDWSHHNIAELFYNLAQRGYIIVYLTARNIGQALKTLRYLKSIKQKEYEMPEGPLITSPDSLFESFRREIIIKNPEVFKIQVLRDLRSLFGDVNYNPLFAGFGNKDTDAISYRVVNIPKKRIFTITPASEIYMIKSKETYSYSKLNQCIDEFFPEFDQNKLLFTKYEESEYWSQRKMMEDVNNEDIDELIKETKN